MARGDETVQSGGLAGVEGRPGALDLPWEDDESATPPAHRTRQQRRRIRARRRRRRLSHAALVIAGVLLVLLGTGVYWGVGVIQNNQRVKELLGADYSAEDMGQTVPFFVQPGDGGTTIAVKLLDAGVIESRAAFVQVCQTYDQQCRSIQPGRYLVQLRSPAKAVFDILTDPTQRTDDQFSFTVREGSTVIEILAYLAERTAKSLDDFKTAAEDLAGLGITPEWYARTDGKPAAAEERNSMEGFLFPDTYYYDPLFSARQILQLMVDQFFRVAERVQLKQRAQDLGISPYEVIITASLVQAEGHPSDFGKVARVAYNRVYKDMIDCQCLQFDSTTNYWLEVQQGSPRDPGFSNEQLDDPDNPYNTYPSTPGLPIGPIGSPSEAALRAAANPEPGAWIYFTVVKPDGTTAFSTSFAQFCADKREGVRNGVDLFLGDC